MKILFASLAFLALIILAASTASAAITSVDAPGSLKESGRGWPACAPTQKQWSGYFNINVTDDKNYFYWMIESKKPNTNKLVIWLSGGPGCSSDLALLGENGPCQMNETTGELYQNPYSWTNEATVVWLDQPANVGFSYSNGKGADSNEKDVARDGNAFIQHLLAAHPEMQSYEFYVTGESYSGHYSAALSSKVWSASKSGENKIKVNLKGLAVGNGLVAPVIQYKYYEQMATQGCEAVRADGTPCVSKYVAEQMNSSIPSCIKACKECDAGSIIACDIGRSICNGGEIEPYSETGLNPYNVRIPCAVPPLCYSFSKTTEFLNRADVKASLGVPSSVQWQTCNFQVNSRFGADWLRRYDLLIPPMLADGIRYLNYAGDLDFICNWLGNQAVALELPWAGQKEFNNAPFTPWTVDGTTIAHVRSVSSPASPIHMTFMKVSNAGHMVPKDQPETASKMINAFLNNEKFIQN